MQLNCTAVQFMCTVHVYGNVFYQDVPLPVEDVELLDEVLDARGDQVVGEVVAVDLDD